METQLVGHAVLAWNRLQLEILGDYFRVEKVT